MAVVMRERRGCGCMEREGMMEGCIMDVARMGRRGIEISKDGTREGWMVEGKGAIKKEVKKKHAWKCGR